MPLAYTEALPTQLEVGVAELLGSTPLVHLLAVVQVGTDDTTVCTNLAHFVRRGGLNILKVVLYTVYCAAYFPLWLLDRFNFSGDYK